MTLLMSFPFLSIAQHKSHSRYQGEVDFLALADLGAEKASGTNVEFVNGIRFNRNLFTGIGLGISAVLGEEYPTIPLFWNFKGYVPMRHKMDMLIGVNIGTKLDPDRSINKALLLRPEWGIHFQSQRNFGIDLALIFERFTCWTKPSGDHSSRYIGLYSLGFRFGIHF